MGEREYRVVYEWISGKITYSAIYDSMHAVRDLLWDSAKNPGGALRGGWLETREVTPWEKT